MQLSQAADESLFELVAALKQLNYEFVTSTPATHQRVIARPEKRQAKDLRDIFGWSLPFAADLLPQPLLDLMARADALDRQGDLFRAKIRVSTIHNHLFLHSAFPTDAEDSVFFGPDTYRFVDFIRAEAPRAAPVRRLVDIGSGAGVGGILAAPFLPGARITLMDVNPLALRLAAINARHAGVEVEIVEADTIEAVSGLIDLAIANPPYVMDPDERTYRDGGDMHGARLSLDWTLAAARRIESGGRVLLYTGVAIVDGHDALREALERELPVLGCTLRYRELDPDIFGEELEKPAYADVERIAAIGAVIEAAR